LAHHVLDFHDDDGDVNNRLQQCGVRFPYQVLCDARNPGFYDPFDLYHDVTLTYVLSGYI